MNWMLNYCFQSSHCKLVFMLCNVRAMRLLTESMESTESFAVGELLISIWKAIVSNDPPSVLFSSGLHVITKGLVSIPSGRIEKPEGNIATLLESHPVITACIPFMSTGAYITVDSYALQLLSWSTHILCLSLFRAWMQQCYKTRVRLNKRKS